ncbi:hypothetical protein [Phenylobacterium sp.]|uniref:hypothetical protein n=1 Tax=Phenylobacterium sp. TaxID=1871053 RepID=UPI0035B154DE
MNLRRVVLGGLALACSGCSGREPEEGAATPVAPPAGPAAYVGVWAAQPDLCGRTVWRLSPTALTAESGATCLLEEMRPDAGGWTGVARCGEAAPGVISLRVTAAPTDSMVVSAPFSAVPITLLRCPDPGEGPALHDPHGFLDRAAGIDRRIAAGGDEISSVRPEDNVVVQAVWAADGRVLKISTPFPDGDNAARARDYYFDPEGELFLVQDPRGAFGFVGDRLVTLYGPSGAVLPPSQAPEAGLEASLLRQAGVVRPLAESLLESRRQATREGRDG